MWPKHAAERSVDDLNNSMGAAIDHNCVVVHDRIVIAAIAILRGDVVIADAGFRKLCANLERLLVSI